MYTDLQIICKSITQNDSNALKYISVHEICIKHTLFLEQKTFFYKYDYILHIIVAKSHMFMFL